MYAYSIENEKQTHVLGTTNQQQQQQQQQQQTEKGQKICMEIKLKTFTTKIKKTKI